MTFPFPLILPRISGKDRRAAKAALEGLSPGEEHRLPWAVRRVNRFLALKWVRREERGLEAPGPEERGPEEPEREERTEEGR